MGGCYIYDTKDSHIHSFRNCEGARPTLTPWALGPGMLFQFKSWCKKGDRRSLMIELLRLKGNGVQYMALPWFAQYILYTKISFKLFEMKHGQRKQNKQRALVKLLNATKVEHIREWRIEIFDQAKIFLCQVSNCCYLTVLTLHEVCMNWGNPFEKAVSKHILSDWQVN